MVGQVVSYGTLGKGTITQVELEGKVVMLTIAFETGEKEIQYSRKLKHLFQFENAATQQELDDIIQRVEKERNYVFERRTEGCMFFIVFQNRTFDVESRGNYLWAPTSDARGAYPHYWRRLTQARKGDIILHCKGGAILAVSTVVGSCYNQVQTNPIYRGNMGRDGMRLDTQYSVVSNPIFTRNYTREIMSTYPAGSTYAPFNRNGGGVQGYLFELAPQLAQIFLHDLAAQNPGMHF